MSNFLAIEERSIIVRTLYQKVNHIAEKTTWIRLSGPAIGVYSAVVRIASAIASIANTLFEDFRALSYDGHMVKRLATDFMGACIYLPIVVMEAGYEGIILAFAVMIYPEGKNQGSDVRLETADSDHSDVFPDQESETSWEVFEEYPTLESSEGSKVQLNPEYAETLISQAKIFMRKDQLAEALVELDEALNLPLTKKLFVMSHACRAEILMRLNFLDEAKRQLDSAIEKYPQNLSLLSTRAVILYKMGDSEGARAHLKDFSS